MRIAALALLLVLASCAKEKPSRPAPPPTPQPAQHPLYVFPDKHAPRACTTVPRLIHRVEPTYTPEARRLRISGIVILAIVVEPNGRVSAGNVLKPLPFGLTQSAIDAVGQWKYEAGRRERCLVNVTLNFKVAER